MTSQQACCICSSLLDTYDEKTEKPIFAARYLPCCSRAVCQRCLTSNPRFNTLCPYCVPEGLRDPPPYDPTLDAPLPCSVEKEENGRDLGALPPYSDHDQIPPPSEKADGSESAPDVLHFLAPDDSLRSLSLAYRVPIDALRRTNNIYADHLVQGRRTLLIPGEHYKGGVSLSPRPVEGEEEETKKSKVRRWMVACKVAEYDVALLYLEQVDYDLDAAIDAYREDERWEKDHPLDIKNKGKSKTSAGAAGMRRFVGSSSESSASRR